MKLFFAHKSLSLIKFTAQLGANIYRYYYQSHISGQAVPILSSRNLPRPIQWGLGHTSPPEGTGNSAESPVSLSASRGTVSAITVRIVL